MKRNSIRIGLTTLLAVLLFAGFTAAASAQVVVIANKNVTEEKLSKKELLELYTLNQSRWEDGSRVVIFDLKKNDPVKQSFYEFIEIEQDELRKIWLRKQFTGKAVPPRVLDSEDDVLEHVATTPGAIGYVSLATAKKNKDVRIVSRIR